MACAGHATKVQRSSNSETQATEKFAALLLSLKPVAPKPSTSMATKSAFNPLGLPERQSASVGGRQMMASRNSEAVMATGKNIFLDDIPSTLLLGVIIVLSLFPFWWPPLFVGPCSPG